MELWPKKKTKMSLRTRLVALTLTSQKAYLYVFHRSTGLIRSYEISHVRKCNIKLIWVLCRVFSRLLSYATMFLISISHGLLLNDITGSEIRITARKVIYSSKECILLLSSHLGFWPCFPSHQKYSKRRAIQSQS